MFKQLQNQWSLFCRSRMLSQQPMAAIDLYPKNEEIQRIKIRLSKKKSSVHLTQDMAARVTYQLTTEIPADVWSYENYRIQDDADPALWMEPKSLKVQVVRRLRDSG
jgi:hypothetical protein